MTPMMYGPGHGTAMGPSHLNRSTWHTTRSRHSVTWLQKYGDLGSHYVAKLQSGYSSDNMYGQLTDLQNEVFLTTRDVSSATMLIVCAVVNIDWKMTWAGFIEAITVGNLSLKLWWQQGSS
jgi:hypothetical protein